MTRAAQKSGHFTVSTRHAPERREGHVAVAEIKCRKCSRTETADLPGGRDSAWASGVFRHRGWLVGNGLGRHLCPGCQAQRPPSELTPQARRAAYLRIEGIAPKKPGLRDGALDGRGALSLTLANPDGVPKPDEVQPIDPDILKPDRMAGALSALGTVTPAKPAEEPAKEDAMTTITTAATEPAPAPAPGKRPRSAHDPVKTGAGDRSRDMPIMTRGFKAKSGARTAAVRYLAYAKLPAGSAIDLFEEPGVGWAWKINPPAEPAQPEPQMTKPVTVTPPRQPTREDFRAIQDALDTHYDVDRQRYRDDMTDAKLAERLDKPRGWVTSERDRAYGPEANEVVEKADAKWRAAMVKAAGQLVTDAMELAARVEALQVALAKGPV